MVPHLHHYNELLRLPAVPPTALRFLRLVVPPCARLFVSPGDVGTPSPGRGYLDRGFPNHCSVRGNVRVSQVPGGSYVCMPCSRTPVRLLSQVIAASKCCLPLVRRRRLLRFDFRGSITRPTDFLCTLRGPDYSVLHATLGTGCLPGFAGRGIIPAVSHCEVSVCHVTRFIHPPHPSLAWRA